MQQMDTRWIWKCLRFDDFLTIKTHPNLKTTSAHTKVKLKMSKKTIFELIKSSRVSLRRKLVKNKFFKFSDFSTFHIRNVRVVRKCLKTTCGADIEYFAAISNQTGVASVLQHNFWSRQDKNTNRVSFESLDVGRKILGYEGPQLAQISTRSFLFFAFMSYFKIFQKMRLLQIFVERYLRE